MPPKALPGFRDFYPAEFAIRSHILDTWRRIVRRYAFLEYDGPPLEPLELYTQKSGEARWLDIPEGDLDEARLTNWMKQAAKLPGWKP